MNNEHAVKIAECKFFNTIHVLQGILKRERVENTLKKVPQDLYGSGSGIFLMVKKADVGKAVDIIEKAGFGRSLSVMI